MDLLAFSYSKSRRTAGIMFTKYEPAQLIWCKFILTDDFLYQQTRR